MVFGLNSRGQEEAPFEVLVAVVIMGFVLIIGLQAMTVLNDSQCAMQAESQLENLKTQLETVINQRTPQTIDFAAKCTNPMDDKVTIKEYDRPRICADFCSSGASICTLLEYSNTKKGLYFKKCLKINPSTVFITQNENLNVCDDLSDEGKILVNFREQIPRSVLEVKQKQTGETFPTICAYCKKNSGSCPGGS